MRYREPGGDEGREHREVEFDGNDIVQKPELIFKADLQQIQRAKSRKIPEKLQGIQRQFDERLEDQNSGVVEVAGLAQSELLAGLLDALRRSQPKRQAVDDIFINFAAADLENRNGDVERFDFKAEWDVDSGSKAHIEKRYIAKRGAVRTGEELQNEPIEIQGLGRDLSPFNDKIFASFD